MWTHRAQGTRGEMSGGGGVSSVSGAGGKGMSDQCVERGKSLVANVEGKRMKGVDA